MLPFSNNLQVLRPIGTPIGLDRGLSDVSGIHSKGDHSYRLLWLRNLLHCSSLQRQDGCNVLSFVPRDHEEHFWNVWGNCTHSCPGLCCGDVSVRPRISDSLANTLQVACNSDRAGWRLCFELYHRHLAVFCPLPQPSLTERRHHLCRPAVLFHLLDRADHIGSHGYRKAEGPLLGQGRRGATDVFCSIPVGRYRYPWRWAFGDWSHNHDQHLYEQGFQCSHRYEEACFDTVRDLS